MDDKKEHGEMNRRKFIQLVAVAGVGALGWKLGLAAGERLQVARWSQPLMGTVLNLTVYGRDRDRCEEVIQKTVSTMAALEAVLSRHRADSALSRLNRRGRLDNPDRHLLEVLTLAREISRKSSGSFDVTVLPLLRLYEAGRASQRLPLEEALALARERVGFEQVELGEELVRLKRPGMGLSLDGIAKGYIVDQGVAVLKENGFENVYLEAGGDLMVCGRKSGRAPWRIGLRSPRPRPDARPVILKISDRAVATSGDYLQFYTSDLLNHHIINPKSGFSPRELASCTVSAPNVALADGLATAVMVLGKKDGLELLESIDGCEGYVVDKQLRHAHSSGFFA